MSLVFIQNQLSHQVALFFNFCFHNTLWPVDIKYFHGVPIKILIVSPVKDLGATLHCHFTLIQCNKVSGIQVHTGQAKLHTPLCRRRIFRQNLWFADKLWCTTALIYTNNGLYYTVSRQTPDKEVRTSPYTAVPNSQAGVFISPASTDRFDFVVYRIEIVYAHKIIVSQPSI